MVKVNIDNNMKNYDKYNLKYLENNNVMKQNILDDISNGNNIIMYSNNDYSNYCNILSIFRKYSPKKLKFVRKMDIEYNSNIYSFNTTDVFVDVDFELLGVNEYHVFMELYNTLRETYLQDSIYILCNNFYKIKKRVT